MDKRFWGIIAVIGVIFIGIIWINGRDASAPSGGGGDSTAAATEHIQGDNAKGVTLVEYGDFQCPVCALYEPIVKEAVEKHKADIAFQFRNFPLPQIHENAFAASRAAEAAGMQNKYWEMYSKLYQMQNEWSNAGDPIRLFQNYAQTLGLNADKFETDIMSDQVNDAINADMREGNKLKVSGTPSFFLNGKRLELSELVGENNQPSANKLSAAIEKAIKEKEQGGQQ